MREITEHQTNDCNRAIRVYADEPDPKYGNASHEYRAEIDANGNAEVIYNRAIAFQRGPVKEVGVNGLTNEVLLAILIDRMRGFQSGPFACRENALALTKLEEAFHWFEARTRARLARGVEGTNVV
jgi:hypothetical protein